MTTLVDHKQRELKVGQKVSYERLNWEMRLSPMMIENINI